MAVETELVMVEVDVLPTMRRYLASAPMADHYSSRVLLPEVRPSIQHSNYGIRQVLPTIRIVRLTEGVCV